MIAERKDEKLKESSKGLDEDNNGCEEDIGRRTRRRLALLDLLLDLHLKDATFTLEDVAEEVDNFMFAVSFDYTREQPNLVLQCVAL